MRAMLSFVQTVDPLLDFGQPLLDVNLACPGKRLKLRQSIGRRELSRNGSALTIEVLRVL